ncbi:MAG TPA: hypothetical protein ENI88_14780 [Desulfobulbus sp.]|nr:hypothetical protein [Desulfobulbus sp.]
MFLAFFFSCFLILPANAWALQSHGAPEGLYVHQMAHVFFFLALVYLYWDISRSSFSGRGWVYLKIFCVLMLFWNIVAFVGHAVAIHIDVHIVPEAGYLHSRIQGPITLHKAIFFITKFDHLLAVPALFFLYIGMRSLYRSSIKQHAGKAKR